MFLVQIKNIFVEKNIFCLVFVSSLVFPLLQDISFKHVVKHIELTRQTKNVHKIKKNIMFIKNEARKAIGFLRSNCLDIYQVI